MAIQFDGQQTDERILYTVTPHPLVKTIAIANVIVVCFIFYLILFVVAQATPLAILLRILGFVIVFAICIAGALWNAYLEKTDRTYITDRRVIRFETVTPVLKTKRALFWNEALKAKAFAPSFLYRSLGIGEVIIEPQLSEGENVIVRNVSYYNDLANYIDKILFTFKNKPGEIGEMKPFVPKPKGQRD